VQCLLNSLRYIALYIIHSPIRKTKEGSSPKNHPTTKEEFWSSCGIHYFRKWWKDKLNKLLMMKRQKEGNLKTKDLSSGAIQYVFTSHNPQNVFIDILQGMLCKKTPGSQVWEAVPWAKLSRIHSLGLLWSFKMLTLCVWVLSWFEFCPQRKICWRSYLWYTCIWPYLKIGFFQM
jgi:hypothetical protein